MVYYLLLCFYINSTQYFGKPGPFFYPKVNPTVFQRSIRSMMLHHILNSTSQKFLQRVLKEQQCQWKRNDLLNIFFFFSIRPKLLFQTTLRCLSPELYLVNSVQKYDAPTKRTTSYIKRCEPYLAHHKELHTYLICSQCCIFEALLLVCFCIVVVRHSYYYLYLKHKSLSVDSVHTLVKIYNMSLSKFKD